MKRSKAYRIEQRERVVKNRKRLIKELGTDLGTKQCDGMMDKKHPLDCGKPGCLVCHRSKLFDEATANSKRLEEKLKIDLEEV